MRKSLRQIIRQQPKCANCNISCGNEKRCFSDALPEYLEHTKGPFCTNDETNHDNSEKNNSTDSTVKAVPRRGRKPKSKVRLNNVDDGELIYFDLDAGKKPLKGTTVTLFDALLKIFNMEWKSQKSIFKNTIKDREILVLCDKCVWCLSQLYDCFLRFTKLTIDSKPRSYLHSVIYPKLFAPKISTKEETQIGNFVQDHSQTHESTTALDSESSKGKPDTKRKRFEDDSTSGSMTKAKDDSDYLSSFENQDESGLDKTRYEASNVSPECMMMNVDSHYPELLLKPCKVELDEFTPENMVAALAKLKQENDTARIGTDDLAETLCSDSNLEAHKDSSLETYLITEDVGKQRAKRGKLQKPIKIKKAPKPADCVECGKNFSNSTRLETHQRIHHTLFYDCPYCEERYSDRRQHRDHLSTVHADQKLESCRECNKRYFTKADLKKHSLVHVDKKAVVCTLCNGTFPSETILKAHKLTHIPGKGKIPKFICPVSDCQKRYTNLQLLQSHHRYIHERRSAFICPMEGCKKSFGTETYLNAHIVSHESIGSHLCELCGKNYKHKKDLRIHEQRFHSTSNPTDLKANACEVCPKRYYRADHLRLHQVKMNHYVGGQEPEMPPVPHIDPFTQVEEFKCDICSKDFVSDMALKTHKLTHEDETEDVYPFACSECSRRYTNMKALDYHLKYMHLLKGTFACSYCPKSFGRMSSFKRHLAVHSKLKHICGTCRKGYKNKADLVQHYRREHILGVNYYQFECNVCQRRFYRMDMLRLHLVRSGHVGHNTLPTTKEEEQENQESEPEEVSVYVVETTEMSENRHVVEEIQDDESQSAMVDGKIECDTILPDDSNVVEVVETLTPNGAPIIHRMQAIPIEMVEITGEDEQGTIAHVMMMDDDGVTQDIETEVVCTSQSEVGNLVPSLSIFNYSIRLE